MYWLLLADRLPEWAQGSLIVLLIVLMLLGLQVTESDGE